MTSQGNHKKSRPYVRIIEQPAKAIRFRYEREGRAAGKLDGEMTTDHQKTYPTIKIENYKGPAQVVVSCVSKDPPYYPHPHNLVSTGKQVSNGIRSFITDTQEMIVRFQNLRIQCVPRKNMESSLEVRKSLGVDPFKTGFDQDLDEIDICSIRLCFQVFLEGKEKGKFNVPLTPVVSEPIQNRRAKAAPWIDYISHRSATADGGTEMCILCEKATREDIEVRFYRQENNWEAIAELIPPNVYKQIAIVFKSPKYPDTEISEPVIVMVQLRRISDGEMSDPLSFRIMPTEKNARNQAKRKRSYEKFELAEQIQAEALKFDAHLLVGPDDSWMQPETKIKPAKPFIPVVTIKNNELNEMRNQALMQPATLDNELNNINNVAFDYSNYTQKAQTNGVYEPHYSLNKSQQCQNSAELYSDTLTDDSWIKDIISTLDLQEFSLPTPQIASKCTDNFAFELATKCMHFEQMTQNNFANDQQIYVNSRNQCKQRQMDQNISDLAASVSGNLSNLNFADLIKIDDMDNVLAETNIDKIFNRLQDIDYLTPLMEEENVAQNINQPIEMPIETLIPPHLLT
ncbi:embryonic polarity protein dorsal isoform X2 [Nasonia vitripennis]|uniref:RHD domain-containing protein n=1 Tax=Nasonia vitripennis TaxID=7425 RepID=A0A7M7QJ32_NASVI|nr:embryonic polarity protein dorsal isoform X2 [Nasonia vitripennis]